MKLTKAQQTELLALARSAIRARFEHQQIAVPQDKLFSQKLGLFVSLHRHGELRGCIGYVKGHKSITESVVEMAQAAAFRDIRFPPLAIDEMEDLEIEISVLGPMMAVTDTSEVEVGRDGLYLEHPWGSGLLLPQVALEWHWDRKTFLLHICQKAGLQPKAWEEEGARLYRFEACVFGDSQTF